MEMEDNEPQADIPQADELGGGIHDDDLSEDMMHKWEEAQSSHGNTDTPKDTRPPQGLNQPPPVV